MAQASPALQLCSKKAQVWGPARVGEPDLVKQYIYRLRQKIEPDPNAPQFIHSVRGEGYYFDADDLP